MIAVGIACSNKRVAVRYVPLMLQGPARAWLNSLQPNSVNSWLDFKTAFVRNFTSTYVRPSSARLLALCVQDQDEPDHAYIKRWSELQNRCENVPEVLAI